MNNYVYQYINPITMLPFYVGRGINGRIHDRDHNDDCMATVEQLETEGYSFVKDIAVQLKDGLTVYEAQLMEATLISTIGLSKLTNRREELSSNKIAVAMGLADTPVTFTTVIEHMALLTNGADSDTPEDITQLLWSKLDCAMNDILNPCGGTGTLLNGHDGTIVEVDDMKAWMAKMPTEDRMLNVVNADYLEWVAPKQYDLIVMNPPFKLGSEMIMKAVTELKDGGTLAFIMQSTWRGRDIGKKSYIYDVLCKMGAFKSIHMLSMKENKSFGGVKGTIDLVVFQKGVESSTVAVRNPLGDEFTFIQKENTITPPAISTTQYEHYFDNDAKRNNWLVGAPGLSKAGKNCTHEIVTMRPTYMSPQYEQQCRLSDNKKKLMYQPKLILSRFCNSKVQVVYDVDGTQDVHEDGYFIPCILDTTKVAEFIEYVKDNNIFTACYIGSALVGELPPIRLEQLT